MNPEDQLRDRLHHELGDPAATPTNPGDPGGSADAGWTAIEQAGHRRDQRRRLVVTSGVVVAVALMVAGALLAASHTGQTSTALRTESTHPAGTGQPRPSTTPTSVPPTTSLSGLPTTTGVGSTTIPVTITGPEVATTAAPITSSTTPSGQVDCGTAELASGWPTTMLPSPTLEQCILSAFAAGTPAVYVERAQTDGEGGHIRITTYEVIGVRQARRTVDATGAQPPGGIAHSICTDLASGPDGQLAATGCTPA